MRQFIIVLSFLGLVACTVDKESKLTLDKLKIRDSIKDSLRQVIRDSLLNSPRVGDAGLETPEFRRVSWIIKTSDNEELKELTRSDNAFVKAIGLKGLFMRHDKDWFQSFKTIAQDTGQYVFYQDGCFRFGYRLPEYFLLEVVRYETMDGILTPEQIEEINDLIEKYGLKVLKKQTAHNTMLVPGGGSVSL